MNTDNQQQEMEELTPEQLAERKEEMKAYFEDALPYLKAQHEYEKMLAEISEFKFKRFQYDAQLAMSMHQMNHPEEQESEERYTPEAESPKERKLKKG